MRLLLMRVGRIAGRALLAIGALAVAEFIGVAVMFSGGIVLVPLSPYLVAGGVVAGCAALVVGAVRARRGSAAGGIGGFDLLLHSLLLANAVLVVGLVLLLHSVPRGVADWCFGGALVCASFALVGIPLSVGLSWSRAFTAPTGGPVRVHRWVLRVAHAADLALGAVVLASSAGGLPAGLIGSLTS